MGYASRDQGLSRSEDVASRPEIKSSNSVAPSIDAIMINNVDDAVSAPGSHQKEPRPAVQLQADATPAPTHAVDHQTTLQSRRTLLEKSESRNLVIRALSAAYWRTYIEETERERRWFVPTNIY